MAMAALPVLYCSILERVRPARAADIQKWPSAGSGSGEQTALTTRTLNQSAIIISY